MDKKTSKFIDWEVPKDWVRRYSGEVTVLLLVLGFVFLLANVGNISSFLNKYIGNVLSDILSQIPPNNVRGPLRDPYFYVGLESVATTLGSIFTGVTLVFLLIDSRTRTRFERENLDINKREQRAFLRPINVESFFTDDRTKTCHFHVELDKRVPMEKITTTAAPVPSNFFSNLYDVNNGTLILIIENIGKGMAEDVSVELSSSASFEPKYTVVEQRSYIPSGKNMFIWKDSRYDNANIHLNHEGSLYLRIRFTSSYVSKDPETKEFYAEIKPYPRTENKSTSFSISGFYKLNKQ